MPEFFDKPYPVREYEVRTALDDVLAKLPRPAPTRVVVTYVAQAIGAPPKEVAGLVLAMAPNHPCARQDGAVFKQWGKPRRRWTWYPPEGQKPPVSVPAAVEVKPVRDRIRLPGETDRAYYTRMAAGYVASKEDW
jgi:hypothetical protein